MRYSPLGWFLLSAAFAAAPQGPLAQQFVAKRHDDLPRPEHPASLGAVPFDLGADGDADVVLPNGGVFENLGDGRFVEHAPGALLGPFGLIAEILVGDVDADGDDDLVVVGGPTELWVQEPGGILRLRGTPVPGALGHDVELFDLDGDGDLDMVRGDGTLWRNDGRLPFTDVSAWLPPGLPANVRSLASDLDGDGDLDLLHGLLDAVRVLLNDGSGRFADHTPAAFPGGAPRLNRRSFLGDFDADGDVDLIHHTDSLQHVDLLFNDGSARFASVRRSALQALPSESLIAVFDADGDRAADLAISGQPLWRNDGAGNFSPDPQRIAPFGGMLAADFDSDGDVDLFASPWTMVWNEHDLAWATPGESLTHGAGFAFAIDAEGDGDLDLLANGRSLLINDGRGHFANLAVPPIPTLDEGNYSAAVADFDGDGRDDLLLGAEDVHLWTADGRGGFVLRTTVPMGAGLPAESFAADVDRDGDVDAAVSARLPDGTHRLDLLRNDGFGGFAVVTVVASTARALRGFLDLDGDGDPDLITADAATWFNDGAGGFVPGTTLGLAPYRAQAGDLDGDGDVDLFTVVRAADDVLTVQQALNDGHGNFALGPVLRFPEVGRPLRDVQLADLDVDGDLDAVLITSDPMALRQSVLLLNAGQGPSVLAAAERTGAAFLGGSPVDVDGDGDPDFFGAHEVVENRQLQLASRRTARVGGALALEFAWQPGYGTAGVVAVAWIGPTPLAVPRPIQHWGRLRLDPAACFDLPLLALGAAGEVTTEVPIPAVPALAGVALFSQALFAPSIDPTTWRLSGLVRERILR